LLSWRQNLLAERLQLADESTVEAEVKRQPGGHGCPPPFSFGLEISLSRVEGLCPEASRLSFLLLRGR